MSICLPIPLSPAGYQIVCSSGPIPLSPAGLASPHSPFPAGYQMVCLSPFPSPLLDIKWFAPPHSRYPLLVLSLPIPLSPARYQIVRLFPPPLPCSIPDGSSLTSSRYFTSDGLTKRHRICVVSMSSLSRGTSCHISYHLWKPME